MFWWMQRRSLMAGMLAAGMLVGAARMDAQGAEALTMTKVDPPNWWAQMPKPMLLVRGTDLKGATFAVSDASLQVEKVVASENGHWAQVWLSRSPVKAETVTLRARNGAEKAEMPYRFEQRKAATEGFAGFSPKDVMYLIMTDRFADGDTTNDGPEAKSAEDSAAAAAERAKIRGWHGGDLRGIEKHLDYLQGMGVTAVWTTPVYENHEADSYHGYGATDLYKVDEHYGSMEDLQGLAKALHKRGMKLVLDTVPNHVGPKHPWVEDEPAPDWFHGTKEHHIEAETHYMALIDPHAPERDKMAQLHGWFANVLPDMDTESPAVAQYLRQNAVWWIEETGADALRIDTLTYVDRPFWNAFNGELKELYPRLTEVGEVLTGDALVVSSFQGGVTRAGVDTKLTTPFDFPTNFALRDVFAKGEPMTKLSDVLAKDELYAQPERLVTLLGNHDMPRFAEGEKNVAAERLAFAYVMTTRGTPQLYSGDELGMKGGEDPDNRKDFPGGFAGGAANTNDAFVAAGRTTEQEAMYSWVAKLGALRKEHVALACGGEQVLASNEDWIVYLRDGVRGEQGVCGAGTVPAERWVVAMHREGKTEKDVSLEVKLGQTWAEGCVLDRPVVLGERASAVVEGDVLQLKMAGDDVLIAECR
jgi:glycosidase